ncbi:heat stress transcription factor A-4d-like [Panicum miliaceum]|uniref:Heat stress transcription factor A-4d-like n=1 Tax=Panicum miliaceum TaxID=4540 RepID=A0A3L6RBB4_PANMI|nr:heat stress transcription factor A-4d-like [Panicum miliaceum]
MVAGGIWLGGSNAGAGAHPERWQRRRSNYWLPRKEGARCRGFRKIDPERWEFANVDFIRGHTHLLKNIHRRKPVHSHSLQNQVNGPLAESERRELEDEINRLKYEKSLLLADLQRQNQQQYGINWQMQSLEDRLVQMEQRQRNIVASLCDILQRHRVVSASMLETDHFSKKRRVPKIDFFVDEPAVEEQQVPFLQTLGAEAPSLSPGHLLNAEPFEKMELALVSLENFFQRAGHGSAEEMYGGAAEPSPDLTLGEMNSAPMDTNIDQQSSAGLNPFSSTTEHAHFPSSLAESLSYAPSPILTLSDINEDAHRTAEVDMNSETTTGDTSQDTTSETEGPHMPAKVNDVFWERFLTGEAESGRQYADDKSEATEAKEDIKIAIDCSSLNHQNNVDQITEQMGHLDSAENGSDATGND